MSTNDLPAYPSAAQLAQKRIIEQTESANKAKDLHLRIKAVELAASFESREPMKLIAEIYEFLSKE